MRGEKGDRGDAGSKGDTGAQGCPATTACNQHITIFLWILGILITTLTVLTTNVIANDRSRIDQDAKLSQNIESAKEQRYEQFRMLTEKMDSRFSEVVQRLSRIETKVETKTETVTRTDVYK